MFVITSEEDNAIIFSAQSFHDSIANSAVATSHLRSRKTNEVKMLPLDLLELNVWIANEHIEQFTVGITFHFFKGNSILTNATLSIAKMSTSVNKPEHPPLA